MNIGARTSAEAIFNADAINKVLENIQFGLDAVNDASNDYTYKNKDLALMANHIYTVEGQSGMKMAFEDLEVYFQDSGIALLPREYKEEYNEWTLRSKGYEIKDASFTPDFFHNELAGGRNPLNKLAKVQLAIAKKYLNVFQPNFVWETLLTVPTEGGDYYSKFGALRNTVVQTSMLENVIEGAPDGQKGSLVRNHYRAIKNGTGVEAEDFQFIKEYIAEYVGIDPNDLRMAGTLATENKLRGIFNYGATLDEITMNGLQGKNIEGMPFNATKMLPDNIIMFYVDTPDLPILTKLINNVEEYRGLTIRGEKHFKKFPETLEEFVGSKYMIEPVGMHFTGRHAVIFLDIDPARADANRIMTQAGLDAISNRKKVLHEQWNSVVR